MTQFNRKKQDGDFKAGEQKLGGETRPEAGRPDFGALEKGSGFSAGDAPSDHIRKSAPDPETAETGSSGMVGTPRSEPAAPNRQPAPDRPARKRYYSPNEVMRKKGCIGCGGMIFVVPLLIAVTGVVVVIF